MGALRGRRIIVTRTEEDARGLAEDLRARGAEVRVRPAIRRVPPRDPAPLAAAIERLRAGGYDGVLLTSPAAVASLRARLGTAPFPARIFGAVGPATEAALRDWGKGPIVVGPRHDGASLAEALVAWLGPTLRGMHFLQPRAEEGREELAQGLAEAGADVEVVAAYRTLPEDDAALAALRRCLEEEAPDAVIFASPSAVRATARALGGSLAGLSAWAVAIGETTGCALREAGALRIEVAAAATEAALMQAVERALS